MLNNKLTSLKGVGKTRAEQLEKLGLSTLCDLIYFFPRTYQDRGNIRELASCDEFNPNSYILTVASTVKTAKIRKNFSISKFRAFDDTASCEIVFFNSPFVKDVFNVGDTYRFYGKLTVSKNKISLSSPKYELYTPEKPLADFVPVYPLTEGISSKILEKLINEALHTTLEEIVDPLPDKIRIENELATLKYAIKNIHSPESRTALEKAIKRLAFDEMFYFALGISMSNRYKNEIPGYVFSPCKLTEFTNMLPYELTSSQKNAINDIYSDTVLRAQNQESGHMARILVGDVGCGKTVCASAAIYIAVKSGYQCAFMAPTEILARQHYNELHDLFGKLGYTVALLTSSVSQKQKLKLYSLIERGEADIVIGTHALLTDKVNFKNLGLIITDEQHRFGVAQRAVLNEKNRSAHMLVMSATPIPRTLALAMYGDLDVSRITEMPKGRQKVDTFVVDESYRTRLIDFMKKQVALGGQCYIVCPAIEIYDTDDLLDNYSMQSMKNVVEYAEFLKQNLPDIQIACMHGKLKASEKDKIMTSFSSGDIKILVSTTVIEVGVNVPNASLMIVENAERYGLSQLHQLRGRVGRGERKSYCILVSSLNTEKARERLSVMKNCYDGFDIANKDLQLRGPGDFFASKDNENLRQSGGFDFKMAKLTNDSMLFEKAFSSAKLLITSDPEFKLTENQALANEIKKRISFAPSSLS